MTTKETCGEHFQVGQSLSGGWPPAICQRDKNHSGTHGLIPDTDASIPRNDYLLTFTDFVAKAKEFSASHARSAYTVGLLDAAKLVCRACRLTLPCLSKDRITYPEPTWLHIDTDPLHPVKCSATVIYEAIRSQNAAPETSL